ncbi:radical SAM/SPASM domain-containing protein [Bdellovibrio sp. NC01]|uniref:radical SAM/SPASM domain-containing protein n=1 Tax=Bdellovibrio sp. NC01 TaxID=2220073 RepID=UPI00115A4B83|nr:radical SAM protein [Bdellovibrio sp. NC01]QDK39086.1 radical SAM/SPASM domain-containing protein [Bdellovibrio sp. NC01]
MQLRRHKDIIAIKTGVESAPVAFHARNLEVAQVSEEAWASMAPTTFDNGFVMNMEPNEAGVNAEALGSLEGWNEEINPSAQTPNAKFKIRALTINVTQICNLHCTYCAAGGDGTYGDPIAKISIEKTLPQIQYFMNKLAEGESFSITFLGGEPLLYPEAIKIIADYVNEIAATKNLKSFFNVITNATLVNDKILDILTAIKTSITVSIDGPPETHDLARPQKNGQGSGKATVEGLKKILAHKSELGRILLHAVFSRTNLEVEKAYRFFSEFNADAYEFTFDVTEAASEANQKFISEMSKVAALAYDRGGETELRKITMFDGYFSALDEQRRSENYCGTGKSLLSLDSNSKLYSCPLEVGKKNEMLGDVENLNTALESLQSPLIEKNKCQTCWARFLCGGGCLFVHKSLTGDKHKKHVSFCERTRSLIALTILYYERSRG